MSLRDRLEEWACSIKRDGLAIYFAARDPCVPWYAKALAPCVAGEARRFGTNPA
jgi:uncharacterized membrane protein YkvA (DUF1232 family)